MHHDLAWWGTFLALLALILMLPVAVLANLLTPMLKNWWAERSVASLKKRIEKLEKQLADYGQNYPLLTPTEHHILRGIEAIGHLGTVGVQLTAIIIMVAVLVEPLTFITHDRLQLAFRMPLFVLGLVAVLFSFVVEFIVLKGIETFRIKRSPIDRDALKKSIAELKERLEQRIR
jgi:hypothetical protein